MSSNGCVQFYVWLYDDVDIADVSDYRTTSWKFCGAEYSVYNG